MSRIHEALKKAEQERAIAQGGATSGFGATPVAEAPTYEEVDATPATPKLGMPDLGGPSNLETLLARCPLTAWNPDLHTMLFMNGNDSARGTE